MTGMLRGILSRAPMAVVLIGLAASDGRGQDRPDSPLTTAADPLFDRPEMIFAQQGPGKPGRRRGQGMMPQDSGVQRKHIEQLRLLKLLEALDLNDEQEPKFLMAFKGMRKQMRQLDERKQTVIERLSEELKAAKPDTRRINGLVDSVLANEAERRESMRSFVESSRGILTPVQVGRLLVFTERFEYELLERVREYRGRMGPRGAMPGGPDDSR